MTFPFENTPTSNLADHLRSGATNPAFSLLDKATQENLVSLLEKSSQDEQRNLLSRMGEMDLTGLIELADQSAQGPTANRGETSYEVKSGESLSRIARAHNISLKAILAANPQIKNPDLIHPKDVIRIPSA